VYLTADSEQEVEALSTDDIYVIGLLSDLAAESRRCRLAKPFRQELIGWGLAFSVSQ
jgi:hypothetical protein